MRSTRRANFKARVDLRMIKHLLFILPWVVLLLSVPWFSGLGPDTILSLPTWAVYSLGITLFYGLVVALLLEFGWNSADEQGPD